MRLVDRRFTSYFFVSASHQAGDLQDMAGKSFSFGSTLSTSGHLMPRYFLKQENILPESFFSSVKYSGAHDRTAYQVRDGLVDIGVANSATIRAMLKDKRLKTDDIRVLWETPPCSDYVWAIQPHISPQLQYSIRDALLNLSPENNQHAVLLSGLDAEGFIPADADSFTSLQQISEELDGLIASGKIN